MASNNQNELEIKTIALIREAIHQDEKLREKHKVGDKFRFVRDRLRALLERLEKKQAIVEEIENKTTKKETEEVNVFVYLYNAHGMNLISWQNMLLPRLFYEYSINRPIYPDKNIIESLLRTKKNRMQHAFLSMTIKKDDIIPGRNDVKDSIGNPILKVREGCLHFNKLIEFIHNAQEYIVSEEGVLIKKS